MSQTCFEDIVGDEFDRVRLDVYLAEMIDDVTRSSARKAIKEGRVTVNGTVCTRPARSMTPGEKVVAAILAATPPTAVAEDLPLAIVYEDEDLVVVDKPSGLVVHPAPGHGAGTLVNALLYHCPTMQPTGDNPVRPGIVHRLDRFTSGLLVVAKSPRAFAGLAAQAREHRFDRRYLALVRGAVAEDRGCIDAPVGRSLSDPAKMAVTGVKAREAVTRFETLERFEVASLVGLTLETGRTHQIRVHLRFAGHPVLGDPVYGVSTFSQWKIPETLKAALDALDGQALHAERLGFTHPGTGETMTFTSPLPHDFQCALDALRAYSSHCAGGTADGDGSATP